MLIRLKSCTRCKHGEASPGDGLIECRRYPPTVVPVPFQKDGRQGLMMQAIFPRVNPDLHCGEWAPKIAQELSEFKAAEGTTGDMPLTLEQKAA